MPTGSLHQKLDSLHWRCKINWNISSIIAKLRQFLTVWIKVLLSTFFLWKGLGMLSSFLPISRAVSLTLLNQSFTVKICMIHFSYLHSKVEISRYFITSNRGKKCCGKKKKIVELPGLQSDSSAMTDINTFDIVNAGDQLSFKTSKQIMP